MMIVLVEMEARIRSGRIGNAVRTQVGLPRLVRCGQSRDCHWTPVSLCANLDASKQSPASSAMCIFIEMLGRYSILNK